MMHRRVDLSDFLIGFISERGGIMSIFNGTTVIG